MEQVATLAPAQEVSLFAAVDVEPDGSWYPIGDGSAPAAADEVALSNTSDSGIPQSIGNLDALLSTIYDLTATKAGELKIPVAGSVGGGISRRVVISEYSQTRTVTGSDGVERRYGYAIRFCLTVNKWDANAKLSLPFLSAQAELGQVEAGWTMQVVGLSGPKIREAVLPPKPLTVETFVIAQQSLEKVIAAVNDPSTQFLPGTVVAINEPDIPGSRLRKAVVQAYALYRLFKGESSNRTIATLGSVSGSDADNIVETYRMMGVTPSNDPPSAASRSAAQGILAGLKVTT